MNNLNDPILPDTSLCAIVRDEMINPAGGIVKFIEHSVPFVEKAVIIDTGSVDGTLQVLQKMQERYPNLSIYTYQFNDFASCRNYAMKQVTTKRVLILDADERISKQSFREIREKLLNKPARGYNFDVYNIFSNGHVERFEASNNPRLFELSDNITYYNTEKNRFEVPALKEWGTFKYWHLRKIEEIKSARIAISHFCTSGIAMWTKESEWYMDVVGEGKHIAPSEVKSFMDWKAINPASLE